MYACSVPRNHGSNIQKTECYNKGLCNTLTKNFFWDKNCIMLVHVRYPPLWLDNRLLILLSAAN